MRSLDFYLVIFLTTATLASNAVQAGCDTSKATFAKNAKAYAIADQALNTVWKQVKNKLPPAQFKTLLESQRNWLEYRDYMAAADATQEPAPELIAAKRCAAFPDAQADITINRTRYLNALVAPSLPNDQFWRGEFQDSQGGFITINPTKNGAQFHMDVVRGPTYHTGTIAGLGTLRNNQLIYRTKTENYETDDPNDTVPVTVTMIRVGNQIVVTTNNAQNFAGARAYFDASYARVSNLDLSAQQALEEAHNNPNN
jgi:uncharacterized protein YecT (DUF1311 family)